MKIEYLLIKPNNDFCSNVDQFKNLLRSNKRITIDDKQISLAKTIFDYMLTSEEVVWKKSKEIVFYLTVTTDEENVAALEEFDSLLRRINDNCGEQFKINTIWDDVSIYYTTKLYPVLIETENLFRKLIYRFMINTAGSAWFSSSTPEIVKKAIKETAQRNDYDNLPDVDQLYLADFIQLGWFFFEKYTTKPLNQDAIKELVEILDNKDGQEEKLSSFIETYTARSNWERYFAEKIDVENLSDKWNELYRYRNKVAHTKRMTGKDYETAQKLIVEIKPAFEKCIDHIDDVEMTEEQAEAVQEVAKETISRPKNTEFSWGTDYSGIISGLSAFGDTAARIGSQVNFDGLSAGLLQMVDQQQRVDLIKSQSGSLLAAEYASKIGEAADTGRSLIKELEPYQGIYDSFKQAAEPYQGLIDSLISPLIATPNYSSGLKIDSSGKMSVSGASSIESTIKTEPSKKGKTMEQDSTDNEPETKNTVTEHDQEH